MTDGTKASVWGAVWLPFGAVHSIAGTALNNARFPGQWFQLESDLHYNWHRSYDPTTGRYLKPDPPGLVDGPSVYGYAANNPQLYIDPDGQLIQAIPLIIGGGFGALTEYLGNPCATAADILIAGGLGAIGGGFGSFAIRHSSKALTREIGLEWSHSPARKLVNRFTSGRLNNALNRRGGLNGSWVKERRAYKNDKSRFPRKVDGMSNAERFGPKYPKAGAALDRIPDWMKYTGLVLGAAAVHTYSRGCGCPD